MPAARSDKQMPIASASFGNPSVHKECSRIGSIGCGGFAETHVPHVSFAELVHVVAGVPLKSSAKRPPSHKSLHQEHDSSGGVIRAHRSHDFSRGQFNEHSLHDASCEPFLPALYSAQEPVRYLPPTGYT